MLLIAVPLWITEIAPPASRGVMCNIHAVCATLGYLLAAICGLGFYYYQNGSGNQWRAPLAFGCLFPLITLALIPFTPESPRWLLTKDRTDEARTIIERLHHSPHESSTAFAATEFAQMRSQLEREKTLDGSWRILFTRPSYRRRAFIAAGLLSMIYSSGTLVVSNYGPTLFAGLGYDTAQTLGFQAAIVALGGISVAASMLFVDRIPRNVNLAAGMVIVAIPLAVEAALQAKYLNTKNDAGLAAGVAMLFLYIWFYGLFLDGPGYFYANEIFPAHLRAKGTTICICAFSLVNIMWTQVAPIAFDNIGWKFYLVFVCCCLASSVVMFFFFPDTHNKALEEIAIIFGDHDLAQLNSSQESHVGEKAGTSPEERERAGTFGEGLSKTLSWSEHGGLGV